MTGIHLFELVVSLFMLTLMLGISGHSTAYLLQTLTYVQKELSVPHDTLPSQLRCERTPFLSDIILDCTHSDEQVTSYLISQ
ncbi:MAG: hypothetical protein ACO3XO_02280 [Bdellovibrionota bacterium]